MKSRLKKLIAALAFLFAGSTTSPYAHAADDYVAVLAALDLAQDAPCDFGQDAIDDARAAVLILIMANGDDWTQELKRAMAFFPSNAVADQRACDIVRETVTKTAGLVSGVLAENDPKKMAAWKIAVLASKLHAIQARLDR